MCLSFSRSGCRRAALRSSRSARGKQVALRSSRAPPRRHPQEAALKLFVFHLKTLNPFALSLSKGSLARLCRDPGQLGSGFGPYAVQYGPLRVLVSSTGRRYQSSFLCALPHRSGILDGDGWVEIGRRNGQIPLLHKSEMLFHTDTSLL